VNPKTIENKNLVKADDLKQLAAIKDDFEED